MSFAFQGFGLGEFFKAQQRLADILGVYFWGTFDAPSAFLSLGHTLAELSEEIEHLFDENSNPNSAILRSDNRLNVQQMLRVASHGLLDVVQALETLLQITGVSHGRNKDWCQDFFVALRSSRLEETVDLLDKKFAFQVWKLRLFFKTLRKNTIRQYNSILRVAQGALASALEQHSKNTTPIFLGSSSFDIIQRFKDSCDFKTPNSHWTLKSESTLLLILHWLYVTKSGLREARNVNQITVRAYINLIKTAWLLRISYPNFEIDGLSDEARTLIAIMSSEVIIMFQKLRELGVDHLNSGALVGEGDYRIFVEGEVRSAYNGSVAESLDSQSHAGANYENNLQESTIPSTNNEFKNWGETETLWSREIKSPDHPKPSTLSSSFPTTNSTLSGSVPLSTSNFDILETSGFRKSEIEVKSTTHSQSGLEVRVAPNLSLLPELNPSCPKNLGIHMDNFLNERQGGVDIPQASLAKFYDMSVNPISPRLYSWNQKVNKQELGIRPGEMEILPRDLQLISLLVSYTGDRYGRWDSCSIRLFKDAASLNFRILVFKDGLEDIFDEHIVRSQDSELVPEYGYHDHEPIIYIRKNSGLDKGNDLFYRFQNASDMFNLQLAFLGELVEADFHTVRALRIKRNTIESYQKAGVQFLREENTNTTSLNSVTGVGVAGALRSKATVKIHSTRIMMYMYREKTAVFLFVTDSIEIESRESNRTIRIRSSSHNPFKNSVPIKGRTLGTPDRSGGIPLDKSRQSIENEDNFEDFKWFEIDFSTLEELHSFQLEFRKALNLRRRERKHVDDLTRLAMQGVKG